MRRVFQNFQILQARREIRYTENEKRDGGSKDEEGLADMGYFDNCNCRNSLSFDWIGI